MQPADDLIRDANTLAEEIRVKRATTPASRTQQARELSEMQSRLTALWAAIRAARVDVEGLSKDLGRPEPRRSYPKWR
jgi:hypothetical protein